MLMHPVSRMVWYTFFQEKKLQEDKNIKYSFRKRQLQWKKFMSSFTRMDIISFQKDKVKKLKKLMNYFRKNNNNETGQRR